MAIEQEILLDDYTGKFYIKDGLITYDNDSIDLVEEIEKLKLVQYLWGHSLECDKWGVVIRTEKAFEQLKAIGVEIVAYNESPQIHRGDQRSALQYVSKHNTEHEIRTYYKTTLGKHGVASDSEDDFLTACRSLFESGLNVQLVELAQGESPTTIDIGRCALFSEAEKKGLPRFDSRVFNAKG